MTKENQMVERVAKAIYASGHWQRMSMQTLGGEIYSEQRAWDGKANTSRDGCIRLARAAIEAMREPMLDMCIAGTAAAAERYRKGEPFPQSWLAEDFWRGMIDAALRVNLNEPANEPIPEPK